jgi:hypothetical protein
MVSANLPTLSDPGDHRCLLRDDYPLAPTAITYALAVNREGATTAWVEVYRRDRPGSGYVQLWGLGATIERLPIIRAAAEYGLLRAIPKP